MTTRKLILAYLLRQGSTTSTAIYRYVVEQGGTHKAAMSMLSDMVEKGDVKRHKHKNESTCWLADPDAAIRFIGADEIGPVARRGMPLSINCIFDECREHSRVYQLDQLLRSARGKSHELLQRVG